MANRQDHPQNQIQAQNGRKRFVQSVAFTTSSAFTTLNTTCVDGTTIPSTGALLVYQPDADCQIEPGAASRTLTNTNSVWVQAGQQEWSYALPSDVGVNLKGRSGSGN